MRRLERRPRRTPLLGTALVPLAVLLVDGSARSNAPSGHYTLSTSTALDNRTQLRWLRGYAGGGSGSLAWSDAALACQSLSVDGFVGWRLPTARELETIYDWQKSSGNMWDATTFASPPAASAATLWSSTLVVGDPTMVEARNYFTRAYQTTTRAALAKTDFAGVKCVRDP